MCVVRRSGVRPRVLPEPHVPQVRVGPRFARRLSALLRRAFCRLSAPRHVGVAGGARRARRDAPAGSAARARRRQIAGRISRRGGARAPAPRGARAARGARAHARRAARGMAKILDVKGRRVWDSRGRATVEAEVIVGRGATPLAAGRAIAPAGASTGSGEARALDAAAAVKNINTVIRDALRALSVVNQAAIDERLLAVD